MFGQHASTETTPDAGTIPAEYRTQPAHRFPGQAILGIGAEVELWGVVEIFPGVGEYVPTEAQAYVVAVEDIPDGVYEVWQVCAEHGTHKCYAQWEGDVTLREGADPLPQLLYLADVIDENIILGNN